MIKTEKKSSNHENPTNHGSDNMKQGWEIKKLGDFCEFRNGLWTGKKPPFQKVGVIRNTNFTKDCLLDDSDIVFLDVEQSQFQKRKLQYGDIILEKSGGGPKQPVGRVVIFDKNEGDYSFSNFTSVIRIKNRNEVDFNFLHRYLFLAYISGSTEKMQSHSTGIRNLKFDDYKAIEIPLPPLPEQQRIVSILDECFAAIAKAKANTEQNLKNAKELFESYLEDLFSKLFQKNDKKTVSELAKVIGGYSFKSTDFRKEGKYQVIRMGNVRPGIIRENESPVFIDELDEKALSKALLQPNDVIITQTGTKKKRDYGFTVIIEKENYLLNQRIASIRFSDKCLPKFFLYFSWTNIFKDQYFANETGTVGQGNVGIGAITEAILPFIPVNEQKMIIDRIDAVRIEAQKLEAVYQKKIDDLEELKKSILQKAFAGELRSPEGAIYANDGYSPSEAKDGYSPSEKKKPTTIISPERA
jgi:type I restriction enzyme S subunit